MDGAQHIEREIVAAGSRTYGIVTRSQLLDLGCSARQVEYRLKRGTLWPTFRGTYSVGTPASSWRSIWMAAVLSSGSGAMLAGPAAAALWGLTDEMPEVINVHRKVGNARSEFAHPDSGWSVALKVSQRANNPPAAAVVGRIPVLPVTALLLDLAEASPLSELERYVSAASQKKHLNQASVARLIEEGAGRKGIGRLRFQLRYWAEETRNALSILETRFITMCKANGIEVPRTNYRVCGLMVDFVWLARKVVVEADGYTFHGDRLAFERDHDRPAILMRGGYLRMAFTWRQIVERPDEVVATVLAALGSWNR